MGPPLVPAVVVRGSGVPIQRVTSRNIEQNKTVSYFSRTLGNDCLAEIVPCNIKQPSGHLYQGSHHLACRIIHVDCCGDFFVQAPLRDFPCDFARMRECDALGDARKCSSSVNGCAEPHCGNRIIV